jgi:hypothetical protein
MDWAGFKLEWILAEEGLGSLSNRLVIREESGIRT